MVPFHVNDLRQSKQIFPLVACELALCEHDSDLLLGANEADRNASVISNTFENEI